jgi:hypothetical protein
MPWVVQATPHASEQSPPLLEAVCVALYASPHEWGLALDMLDVG